MDFHNYLVVLVSLLIKWRDYLGWNIMSNNRIEKIIVNADDLGMDEVTNQAIGEAFTKGVISSATIMANMPSFDDACNIVHRKNLHGSIGVHLNLSEGKSLTEPIRSISSLCDENGNLKFCLRRFSICPTPSISKVLHIEMKAQIERVIKAGIFPSHLDSHNHDHTIWAIATPVIALAKKCNIMAVRLSANIGSQKNLIKRIYKVIFNARLRHQHLARTSYFGSLGAFETNFKMLQGRVEINVHPAYDSKGHLIDRLDEMQASLISRIDKLKIKNELCSYSDLLDVSQRQSR